jgi:hypothetical protein
MQSAEEMAKTILRSAPNDCHASDPYWLDICTKSIVSLIRARDREIVEACKVAAALASSRTYRDGMARSEAVAEALDSVLQSLA